jgi:hypothetical protein
MMEDYPLVGECLVKLDAITCSSHRRSDLRS